MSHNAKLAPPELFHVGFLVANIESSRDRFESTLGIEFQPITHAKLVVETMHNPDPHEYESTLSYSKQGPVYIELVEADASDYKSLSQGEGIHHLGYWVDDVEAHRALQAKEDLREEVVVRYPGSNKIRQWFIDPVSLHGVRLEFFDSAWRPEFEALMKDWNRGASTVVDPT